MISEFRYVSCPSVSLKNSRLSFNVRQIGINNFSHKIIYALFLCCDNFECLVLKVSEDFYYLFSYLDSILLLNNDFVVSDSCFNECNAEPVSASSKR